MTPATLNITAVAPVGEYALRLSFDDGTVQTVQTIGDRPRFLSDHDIIDQH